MGIIYFYLLKICKDFFNIQLQLQNDVTFFVCFLFFVYIYNFNMYGITFIPFGLVELWKSGKIILLRGGWLNTTMVMVNKLLFVMCFKLDWVNVPCLISHMLHILLKYILNKNFLKLRIEVWFWQERNITWIIQNKKDKNNFK